MARFFPITTSNNSRVVAHYGFLYDYKTTQTAQPMPSIIIKLLKKIGADKDYNQCIINKYQPGQ